MKNPKPQLHRDTTIPVWVQEAYAMFYSGSETEAAMAIAFILWFVGGVILGISGVPINPWIVFTGWIPFCFAAAGVDNFFSPCARAFRWLKREWWSVTGTKLPKANLMIELHKLAEAVHAGTRPEIDFQRARDVLVMIGECDPLLTVKQIRGRLAAAGGGQHVSAS